MNRSHMYSYQPIIIIGAPRSGTNMLRDLISRLPGVGTWPCDEINYIWRHGNIRFQSDEFTPELATEAVRSFIVKQFNKLSDNYRLQLLVEKTCANSLRVGFVNSVIPNAKYIFIVRDGRDVVASAFKRWKAPLNIIYTAKKARFVPPVDIYYYFSKYLFNRIYRVFTQEKRVAYWGPIFDGMREALKTHSIEEVCAMQWCRCVEKSEADFKSVDSSRIYSLRYEDFVNEPVNEFSKLCGFLKIEQNVGQVKEIVSDVTSSNVGKWKKDLSDECVELIEKITEEKLKQYRYF